MFLKNANIRNNFLSFPSKKNYLLKSIYIIFGLISLSLAVIGVFLPGLPTTPFLLLSAYLFFRSSPRLYNWLTSHKFFGKIIRNFNNGKGFTTKKRVASILIMWMMIILSVVVFIKTAGVKIVVLIVGFTGTACMWFYKRENKYSESKH